MTMAQSPTETIVSELRQLEFFEKVDRQDKYALNSEAVAYVDTGISDYDNIKHQTRWEWLLKYLDFDDHSCINGKVGTSGKGKIHLLRDMGGNKVYKNSGYGAFCHKEPSNMRVRLATHADLSSYGLCNHCLNRKRRLTAAKIAIDRTGCLDG